MSISPAPAYSALLLAITAYGAAAQSWAPQTSGSTASLRGVSAVNTRVVWASGTGGTYLQTADGGATWRAAKVPGAEALDFRAIQAVDERTVYLLSIGNGDKSRIYKTADAGAHWTLQLTNPDAKGFLDEIAFWDAERGIALGDPVDGHFAVFTTSDGGAHWNRQETPAAVPNEGAFAASNTSLAVSGDRDAWFGTGGPGGARVFHSRDNGRTWTLTPTPIRNDGAAAGIFSLAFSDAVHGVAVGGDYSKPAAADKNIAITTDGGKTWTEPAGKPPAGFRSAVAWVPEKKMWIVTGTSGSDVSLDGGATWKQFDSAAYNAMSFRGGVGWAVGPRGAIAVFRAE